MRTVDENGPVRIEVPMKVYGDDAYPVWHRRPLPLDAPRARYPGFRPGTELLREGTVRVEGGLPLPCDIVMERDVAVRLRDGTEIYTDIFRPVEMDNCPSLVSWSPYGKQLGGQLVDDLPNRSGVALGSISELNKFEAADPAYWVPRGYVVLNPDTRGAYKSGGNLVYWGRQLAEDGYDFIEWAAAQSWSNGKVGLAGNSWLAASQWYIAAERPPHLAAIAPWEGLSDLMRNVSLRGGIPMTLFPEIIISTFAGENLVEDSVLMSVEEQEDTLYWRDKAARLDRIDVPAYVVASYDSAAHSTGTLDAFRRIGSSEKWLRIHNTHEWPDFYDPRWSAELEAFFDHYLKGEANGWTATPRIRISVIDAGGEDEVNRVVETWPPEGYRPTKLFLTNDGEMKSEAPGDATTVRLDAMGGPPAIFRMTADEEIEVVGYLKLRLWVEAEGAEDMDLVAVVEKLGRDGQPVPRANGQGGKRPFQAMGFQRASRRALDETRSTEAEPVLAMQGAQPLTKGEVVALDVAISATSMKIHKGETLQLMIAPYRAPDLKLPFGSAKITISADQMTYRPGDAGETMTLGGDADTSPDWAKEQSVEAVPVNSGTQIIHLGSERQSHLLVPVKRA